MPRERHPNYRPAASLPPQLRRPRVNATVRDWIVKTVGKEIVRVSRLQGASSAAVHRVHLGDGSSLVLRRYVWTGYLTAEPDAPGRELEALQYAAHHGLAVPEVIAADVIGDEIGDGVPTIVMTFVDGHPMIDPEPYALAEVAAAIHAIRPEAFPHAYFPWYEDEMTKPPPQSSQPRLWERAVEIWKNEFPSYEPAFIHRDFHPGNILWDRQRRWSVVDWSDACRGPRGCDVAHCRWNLRRWVGEEAGDAFLAAYETLTGEAVNPFWVMAGLLEHDHSDWSAERVANDEDDLAKALAKLAG